MRCETYESIYIHINRYRVPPYPMSHQQHCDIIVNSVC